MPETTRPSPHCCEIHAEPLALRALPADVLELLAVRPDPVVLESSSFHADYGRYTLMSCQPVRVLTLRDGIWNDSAEPANDKTGHAENKPLEDAAIWARLSDALASIRAQSSPAVPYGPGWMGYVGYEMGRRIERLPGRAVRDLALPDLRLALYDSLLLYDAVDRRWQLLHLTPPPPLPNAGRSAKTLRDICFQADGSAPADGSVRGSPRTFSQDGSVPAAAGTKPKASETANLSDAGPQPLAAAQSNFTPAGYQQAVARCVEYIAAGDVFQVNLSQRLAIPNAPAPLAIYRALRERNPSWYGAYMSFQDARGLHAVCSSSPELFLRVRGGRVLTRPIKGTRPRTGRAEADDAAARDLWTSPKDNAELAMIIDLLRNDLGRVCRFGSVRVLEPRCLETHPTVFHLVGTIEGRLREGVGPVDLLRATFPGGSITGAPKIRAMEIIDELEGVARGVYCGCIGHVGVDGSAEWNIAIRTIVCDSGTAYVQVGGGIVADSNPLGEYQETLDKARAMLEAVARASRP